VKLVSLLARLRCLQGDDVNIVVNPKKLGQCVEDINKCCNGGSGWSKGKLVVKEMTIVRVHEDRIKEVLDN